MAGIGQIISARHLAILLLLGVLWGCSGADKQKWLGTWEGRYDLGLDDQSSPAATTISKVSLTIYAENRFILVEAGAPKEGRVRYEDDKAYLTVETFMNRPIAEQGTSAVEMNAEIVLTMLNDDTIRFLDPRSLIRTAAGDPRPLELNKTQPFQKG